VRGMPLIKAKRARGWIIHTLIGCALLCAIWFGAYAYMITHPQHSLPSCSPRHAVVIFFGGENTHTTDRLHTGMAQLKRCPDAFAFVIGGARPARGFYGADDMATFLRNRGVSAHRIFQGRLSDDTFSNVHELIALTHAHQITHLTLVSDALHLMRIRFLLQSASPPPPEGLRMEGVPTSPFVAPWHILTRPLYELTAWGMMLLPSRVQRTFLGWVRV
jgi:uncharacterized SAM-binding protein YcdF (DUF218 family)